MSAYKFNDPDGMYFITLTVVEWVDIFTRDQYREIVGESLRYCQSEKGLILHAWVIMSNHIHLIISRKLKGEQLSDIIRNFKKYTSKSIIKAVEENNKESRRNWLLWIFRSAGSKSSNNTKYQFWRQTNHAEQLISNKFMDQKLNYIHMNPVEARCRGTNTLSILKCARLHRYKRHARFRNDWLARPCHRHCLPLKISSGLKNT